MNIVDVLIVVFACLIMAVMFLAFVNWYIKIQSYIWQVSQFKLKFCGNNDTIF